MSAPYLRSYVATDSICVLEWQGILWFQTPLSAYRPFLESSQLISLIEVEKIHPPFQNPGSAPAGLPLASWDSQKMSSSI